MKSFNLFNVKSFENSSKIEVKPITVFVGKNSSGKSSLLRFPVVIYQTLSSHSPETILKLNDSNYVDYGQFNDVVANRSDKFSFEIYCDIYIDDNTDSRYHSKSENVSQKETRGRKEECSIYVEVLKEHNMKISHFDLKIKNEIIVSYEFNKDKFNIELKKVFKNGVLFDGYYFLKDAEYDNMYFFPCYDERNIFNLLLSQYFIEKYNDVEKDNLYEKISDRNSKLNADESKIKDILKSLEYSSNIISHFYKELVNDTFRFTYIGPFRVCPSRVYRDEEISYSYVEKDGEKLSSILLKDYKNEKKILSRLSQMLKRINGFDVDVEEKTDGYFSIVLGDGLSKKKNLVDVGFGISQILPILVQIIEFDLDNTSGKKYCYIEQPELHLHPAMQSDLANVFVESVSNNMNNNYIIETHSEHLIRKLQILVADKNLSFNKEMLKIYFVDKDNEGNSFVKEMKVNDSGIFEDEWPTGFFDQGYLLTKELWSKNSDD